MVGYTHIKSRIIILVNKLVMIKLVHFDNSIAKPCFTDLINDYAMVEANGTLIAERGNWPRT